MIRKNKKLLAYILYGILLTIGLLYYRFPSEAIEDYLQARAERADPRLRFTVVKVSPTLTLGLKFLTPTLSLRANPGKTLFKADNLSVRPVIWTLFREQKKYCFESKAYQGVLEGCIDVSKNSSKTPILTSVTVTDLRMTEDSPFKSLIGRNLVGDLNGAMSYKGPTTSLMNGDGQANLRLSNGRIDLLEPILSLKAIDFNEVLVKAVLRNRKINVSNMEIKARNMQGSLSGIISLKKDLFKSSLDMKGTIEPSDDFFKSLTGAADAMKLFRKRLKRGKIRFVIRGTLAEPRFRLI